MRNCTTTVLQTWPTRGAACSVTVRRPEAPPLDNAWLNCCEGGAMLTHWANQSGAVAGRRGARASVAGSLSTCHFSEWMPGPKLAIPSLSSVAWAWRSEAGRAASDGNSASPARRSSVAAWRRTSSVSVATR